MILQPDDFLDREYKIPNQNESRDLESFIEYHESELLKELLGYDLYLEFTEALEASGELAEKWEKLKDGAEYTYGGKTHKYLGLVDLLRPAIYSKWINVGTYKLTNIGFVQNSAPQQSTLLEDSEPFVVKAWNVFVTKVGLCFNQRASFYGFMTANKEDYPDWDFTAQHFKNRYGL